MVQERLIAKEQGEEDAREGYKGKEKFITKAYKRKLAEREEWARQDAKRQLQEEEQDVTKQTSGQAITTGFYGKNLHKNMAMGGTTTTAPQYPSPDRDMDTFAKSAPHTHSDLDTKEPQDPTETVPSYSDDKVVKLQKIVKTSAEEIRAAKRISRNEKVFFFSTGSLLVAKGSLS